MSLQSVLIIGAGGYLGPPVTYEFLKQKAKFARVAILADPSKQAKFQEIQKDGMEVVLGSFTDPISFQGFDTVISLLGNHAMKRQPAIIDAAIAGGIREFYPSEYGSDIGQGLYLENRYFRDKHVTRNHLSERVRSTSDFHYTLLIVGGFIEFAAGPLFGVDPVKHTFTFYGKPEKAEPLTSTADVAKYLVESTLLPKSANRERTFRVPSGLYTWNETVDAISKAQGVEYDRTYLPAEEARTLAKQYAASGDVDNELAYSLKVIMGDPNTMAVPLPWDNDKFSFKPETLEAALNRMFSKKA